MKSDIAKKKEINYLKKLDCEENLDRTHHIQEKIKQKIIEKH